MSNLMWAFFNLKFLRYFETIAKLCQTADILVEKVIKKNTSESFKQIKLYAINLGNINSTRGNSRTEVGIQNKILPRVLSPSSHVVDIMVRNPSSCVVPQI